MQILARHYRTGRIVRVTIAADRITSIQPEAGIRPETGNPQATGNPQESGNQQETGAVAGGHLWIAPGFVDLQINGYGGHEFNEPGLTPERVREMTLAQDPFGVVAFCPTTTTQSQEVLEHAMRAMAAACERDPEVAARIIGIHLEGPYISSEDGPRGAHPRAHCRPPDWNEFQRLQAAAGGRIRIVTLAPEYDAAPAFIASAVRQGVAVAIGHTNASGDQIRAAVDAGATFSTHLGNAAHPRIRRHPNYIWEQLAEDRLAATLIVDGHHLPPCVVKSFVRGKSPERCVLVSDITGMAGLPPGNYPQTTLGNIDVLDDGRLVVAGQRDILAGASLPIGVGIANVMNFAGLDLSTAVEMASVRAAQLVDYPPPRLETGARADLALFDLTGSLTDRSIRLTVRATIKSGKLVYGSAPGS